MNSSLTRRGFLYAGTSAVALASFGARSAFAQSERLRFLWWGSQERADRTMRAISAYEEGKAGVDLVGEFAGWTDYWPRLATQVAGRNAPDLIQMDYRYIFEYARRSALAPLDDFLFGALNIEDFGEQNIDSGRVDGKLYGVNLGVNSVTVVYDAAAFEKAGVDAPNGEQTWDEIAAIGKAFNDKKSKPNYHAFADGGGVEPAFELWLRQRGKSLYGEDNKLAYTAEDATDWFAMWQAMRESGACVPADVQALDQLDIETNPLTTGKAAAAFVHSNQFIGYQAVNKSDLKLAPYPKLSADAPSGHYLKPSMMASISAESPLKDQAAAFINFLVADVEGAKILGVERGVPASASIREQLAPTLTENEAQIVEYIAQIAPIAGPLPPPPPPGAGELAFVLKRINEQVGFGRTSPQDAGKEMVSEAEAVLARG